jgi:hypothetical protein
MNIPQVNVEELTIKQRLERLGFQVIRNEAPDGQFLGMSVLKDGSQSTQQAHNALRNIGEQNENPL